MEYKLWSAPGLLLLLSLWQGGYIEKILKKNIFHNHETDTYHHKFDVAFH